jgi:hypothetical protein
MKRAPRYPVTINGEMLQAIFTRPTPPSDTRPLIVRLISSLKVTVRGSFNKGIKFIGIRGGADF